MSTGRTEGEARAEAQRIEEKQQIVRKMIQLGISIELVMESTGLTREEVEFIIRRTQEGIDGQ